MSPPILSNASAHPAEFPMTQSDTNNDRESSSAAFSSLGNLQRQPLYRPAKPLSYELRNHSAVYLEDGQYFEGYSFLDSLLVAGTSISAPDKPYPAFIAPPQQLALASSLIAYPPVTTKAKSADRRKGADAALRYLRNLRSAIHPLTEGFMSSFVFAIEHAKRRYRSVGSSSEEDEDRERLNCVAAATQSLWQRAEDFWQIVGWAFDCSVEHKKRWERWKLWLTAMLDLLEAEWTERVRLYLEDTAKDDLILTSSLLWRYIASQDPQSRSTRRRILRAILAMGKQQSKREFAEVWQDETLERKPEEDKTTGPRKINISNDDFGEYGGDEENEARDDNLKVPTRHAKRAAWKKLPSPVGNEGEEDEDDLIHGSDHAVEKLGGMDAILLRQRLLSLLVQVAEYLPHHFTSVEDIYDLYTEFFRPLPTILFGIFLSTSQLAPSCQIALNADLLLPLLSSQLPDYTVLSPSQADLEKYFLPCNAATHSYAANAKIALILESMFRLLMETKSLKASDSLREAVETGINARDIPYGNARRKKGNEHEEEQAKELMELSNERLLGFLDVLDISKSL